MCGIFAFIGQKNLPVSRLVNGLYELKHRGQDAYGYATRYGCIRSVECIQKKSTETALTTWGIGQVRYTTSGSGTKLEQVPPLCKDDIYLVHNGNIPGVQGHDTKYLLNKIDCNNIEKSLIKILQEIPVSYSIILYYKQKLYITRDRYGIRPLYYQQEKGSVIISSETCALQSHFSSLEVRPGSIITVDRYGNMTTVFQTNTWQNNLCAFEIFYLMRDESKYKNMLISTIRENLGQVLAEKDDFDNTYTVIGIPRSGISGAKGYAKKLGLNCVNAINLIGSNRSFISTETKRDLVCHKKFSYNRDRIEDKKVILVDDTIVRGNVMRVIVTQLKKMGVKEVHIRIPAPPVVDICTLGIAIHKKEELLLTHHKIDELPKLLEVSSIKYLNVDDIISNLYFLPQPYMECFGIPFQCSQ